MVGQGPIAIVHANSSARAIWGVIRRASASSPRPRRSPPAATRRPSCATPCGPDRFHCRSRRRPPSSDPAAPGRRLPRDSPSVSGGSIKRARGVAEPLLPLAARTRDPPRASRPRPPPSAACPRRARDPAPGLSHGDDPLPRRQARPRRPHRCWRAHDRRARGRARGPRAKPRPAPPGAGRPGSLQRRGRPLRPTPKGERLRSGVPDSLRDRALLVGEEFMPAWLWARALDTELGRGRLRARLRTNRPHRQAEPELDRAFNQLLSQGLAWSAGKLCDSGLVADAPASSSTSAAGSDAPATRVERTPRARGVLFEQSHVVATAPPDPRITGVGGDFFVAVPEGGDVYLLKNVLHNWDDPRAAAILASRRRATSPGARLLVIELLAPDAPTDGGGAVRRPAHARARRRSRADRC